MVEFIGKRAESHNILCLRALKRAEKETPLKVYEGQILKPLQMLELSDFTTGKINSKKPLHSRNVFGRMIELV